MKPHTSSENTPPKEPWWGSVAVRSIAYQVIALLVIVGGAAWLVSVTMSNLATRNISTGFSFLHQEAGFLIGESLLPTHAGDTYGRLILAGFVNTLRVAAIGIVLSTVLGLVVGLLRLSSVRLVQKIVSGYIELIRNIPLLLQLFFWYALITENAPGPRQAYQPLPGVFLSNRGLQLPSLEGAAVPWAIGGLAAGFIALVVILHRLRRSNRPPLTSGKLAWFAVATLLGGAVLGYVMGGASLSLEVPQLSGFNFQGGLNLSPEFTALMLGLVAYNAAFIGEIVRSGVQSIPKGQWEAAESIGLSKSMTLRRVIIPQALRVMIPPMTNQYLSLIKNSSLAVAIGYPDIVAVMNTTITQTGQAIEGVVILMSSYLIFSLLVSIFMNWYNRRVALVGR